MNSAKPYPLKITHLLLLFSLSLLALSSCSNRKVHKPDKELAGQTAPLDMVFVEGKGNIPSFYISRTEETNLNYNTYLIWLAQVFVDYPEVPLDAEPMKYCDVADQQYNDPFFNNYLRHPAYAYYPVRGVSWMQIQNYLAWKTDRLNESILIKNKLMVDYPQRYQMNEDNFNTEAFLAGQYEAYTYGRRIPIMKGNTRKASGKQADYSNMMFTGYRLPTEGEWDLAFASDLHDPSPESSQKFNPYPYGQSYFILDLASRYAGRKYEEDGLVYDHEKVFTEYEYHWKRRKSNAGGNQGVYGDHYSKKSDGKILHMNGNIAEWLLDYHNDSTSYHGQNFNQYLAENGFHKAPPKAYLDENGFIDVKDSLGRMPYRILSYDQNGNPIYTLDRYSAGPLRSERALVKLYVKYSMNDAEHDHWLSRLDVSGDSTLVYLEKRAKRAIETDVYNAMLNTGRRTIHPELVMHYRYKKFDSTYHAKMKTKIDILVQLYYKESKRMMSPGGKYGEWRNAYHLDDQRWYFFDSQGAFWFEKRWLSTPNPLPYQNKPRLIIYNSDTKNGPQKRGGLDQNKADPMVGFRTVIQHHPMALKKQYKVKWK